MLRLAPNRILNLNAQVSTDTRSALSYPVPSPIHLLPSTSHPHFYYCSIIVFAITFTGLNHILCPFCALLFDLTSTSFPPPANRRHSLASVPFLPPTLSHNNLELKLSKPTPQHLYPTHRPTNNPRNILSRSNTSSITHSISHLLLP